MISNRICMILLILICQAILICSWMVLLLAVCVQQVYLTYFHLGFLVLLLVFVWDVSFVLEVSLLVLRSRFTRSELLEDWPVCPAVPGNKLSNPFWIPSSSNDSCNSSTSLRRPHSSSFKPVVAEISTHEIFYVLHEWNNICNTNE